MSRTKKWLAIAGIGMAVMMLVAIALPVAAASNVAAPVAHGRGWNEGVNGQTYLADALGITAEELQAASKKRAKQLYSRQSLKDCSLRSRLTQCRRAGWA